MKCTVFVTVRTASTRLPRKALLKIGNKSLIQILIDRIGRAKHVCKIVICTTKNKSDDKLTEYLRKNKIQVFRGNNKDILNRLYSAAKKYKVNRFVVVEGDDIFCEPSLIDKTCKKLFQTNYEFLSWKGLPFGTTPIGIKTKKLGELIHLKQTKNTETGWGLFIIKSGLFKIGTLRPTSKKFIRPEIRLSIDYAEDLELAKRIFKNLPNDCTLTDIIRLVDKNPELLKINEGIEKKYKKNFQKKMAKIVIKKDGDKI